MPSLSSSSESESQQLSLTQDMEGQVDECSLLLAI